MGEKSSNVPKRTNTTTKKAPLNVASASNTNKAPLSQDAVTPVPTAMSTTKKNASASNSKKGTPPAIASSSTKAGTPPASGTPVAKRKHKGYVYILEGADGQQDNTPANATKNKSNNKRQRIAKTLFDL